MNITPHEIFDVLQGIQQDLKELTNKAMLEMQEAYDQRDAILIDCIIRNDDTQLYEASWDYCAEMCEKYRFLDPEFHDELENMNKGV